MIQYHETPIQVIHDLLFEEKGIRVIVKREDLNHPTISGNKWWKLRYNLEEARRQNADTLLTFGGAFSNHIYATAAAAKEAGFKSIGIIRGEETLPLNKTLSFAREQGMTLAYVSRGDYRLKTSTEFAQLLKDQYGDFYLIPEGGTNEYAVKGCVELGGKLCASLDFDYLCVPIGTGGTMAGIVMGFGGQKEVIGFSVLKGDFLKDDVAKIIQTFSGQAYGNWTVETSYHHGGYAKATETLLELMSSMKTRHNLPLDGVYTGKLMWGIMEYCRLGKFKPGSTVLVLHTGGLQGAY